MKIIGITGGMGSGKTTVAKIIESMGYPVYFSDDRAKQMYFLPDVKDKVITILGKDAYINDKELNKQYVSEKIFSDKKLLQDINQLIHTAVKKDFEQFKTEYTNTPFIFKESALLFEANIHKECDSIILVTAPESIRIERIKKRDHLSEQEIKKRLSVQMAEEEKIKYSNFIIQNNEAEPLLPKVLDILFKIK